MANRLRPHTIDCFTLTDVCLCVEIFLAVIHFGQRTQRRAQTSTFKDLSAITGALTTTGSPY